MTARGTRIAVALAAGIFFALWFASSILRWTPMLQVAFCGTPSRGLMCTVSTLLFGFVYYAAFTVPVLALLAAAVLDRLMHRRPAAIALGTVLLVVGALFSAVVFALETRLRLAGNVVTGLLANATFVANGLIAVGGLVAGALLWMQREAGRRVAIAVLLLAIASALWTSGAILYRSPVQITLFTLRALLLAWLVRRWPKTV